MDHVELAGKVSSTPELFHSGNLAAESACALALGESTGGGCTTGNVSGIRRVSRGSAPTGGRGQFARPGSGPHLTSATAGHSGQRLLADLGARRQNVTSLAARLLCACRWRHSLLRDPPVAAIATFRDAANAWRREERAQLQLQ